MTVLRVAQGTFLHRDNQCTVKGFDRSGTIMSILDVYIYIYSYTHCEQQHITAL